MKLFIIPILFCLVVVIGCGKTPNPDGRVDVSGTLTLNGQEITDGVWSIFLKSDENHDNGGGGPVYKGKFHLTGRNAPKPGKYRVCLTGTRYIDAKTGNPVSPQTDPADFVTLKILPDDFFNNSKIEFEVVAKKKNIFNYNIETDFKPVEINNNTRNREKTD
ncbi:MAG: hypothetical protein LBP59_04000 [Planctomycetaceae bacterium]|jgi:hypothetical protein|nr:hypothetical protein [Planctomycetaceae bacterium]